MTARWAYIFEQPGADPAVNRFVIDRAGQETTLVAVPDADEAGRVAVDLVDDGIELIELCGGFSLAGAAKVVTAVDGRVPVGHVTFAIESITGAARYKAQFDEVSTD